MEYREVISSDERAAICDRILRALPSWFGVEASIVDYVKQVRELRLFAAYSGGEAVGFAAVKPQTKYAAELCVMGVLEGYHRQGAGRELVALCAKSAKEIGARFLTVKTVAELSPDEGYARTRAFYEAVGFYPLEVFPLFWDEENPCLLSAMIL